MQGDPTPGKKIVVGTLSLAKHYVSQVCEHCCIFSSLALSSERTWLSSIFLFSIKNTPPLLTITLVTHASQHYHAVVLKSDYL